MFQHTAARRRLASAARLRTRLRWFQHTAARRRLDQPVHFHCLLRSVSTHSRPKAAGALRIVIGMRLVVSTHSRPKAAGPSTKGVGLLSIVSTHSRPKAAGTSLVGLPVATDVSTHSRPKAAGCGLCARQIGRRGFNTQPPEGGWIHKPICFVYLIVSTHSRPKAAGFCDAATSASQFEFQHTAARRRLDFCNAYSSYHVAVSTHSRPKAAGFRYILVYLFLRRFNTQPPEGGWEIWPELVEV